MSIFGGSRIGDKYTGYNDPLLVNRFTTGFSDPYDINISIKAKSFVNTLYNVEGVQNYLGIHEFIGHGLKHYRNTDQTHYKAWLDQYNHPTFKKLSRDQQKDIIIEMLRQMQIDSPLIYQQYKNLLNQ